MARAAVPVGTALWNFVNRLTRSACILAQRSRSALTNGAASAPFN